MRRPERAATGLPYTAPTRAVRRAGRPRPAAHECTPSLETARRAAAPYGAPKDIGCRGAQCAPAVIRRVPLERGRPVKKRGWKRTTQSPPCQRGEDHWVKPGGGGIPFTEELPIKWNPPVTAAPCQPPLARGPFPCGGIPFTEELPIKQPPSRRT